MRPGPRAAGRGRRAKCRGGVAGRGGGGNSYAMPVRCGRTYRIGLACHHNVAYCIYCRQLDLRYRLIGTLCAVLAYRIGNAVLFKFVLRWEYWHTVWHIGTQCWHTVDELSYSFGFCLAMLACWHTVFPFWHSYLATWQKMLASVVLILANRNTYCIGIFTHGDGILALSDYHGAGFLACWNSLLAF